MCFPSVFPGSGVKFPHARVESLYLLPQCGLCKSFPIASLSRRDCCFPHVVNYVVDTFEDVVDCFGSVVILLGVILAMLGPRTT